MPRERLYGWFVIVLAAAAVLFGGLWSQERARVAAYRDAAACWEVVRAGGAAYADVTVGVTSHPKAVVSGTLATPADRDRLVALLSEALGAERLRRVAVQVQVGQAKSEIRSSKSETNSKDQRGK